MYVFYVNIPQKNFKNTKYSLRLSQQTFIKHLLYGKKHARHRTGQRQMKPGPQSTYSLQRGSFKAISWTYYTVTILCGRGGNKGSLWWCKEPKGKAWIRVNSLHSLSLEFSTPKLETFFYTPSSQNFGTLGLKQSTGRNEAQGGKWLAVYHKACQWQNLIEHTGPWLLLRNIFGVNCIITIFIPYLS